MSVATEWEYVLDLDARLQEKDITMNELFGIAIGSLTIGAIMAFLGRTIINRGFDAALKTFENKLEILKIEHQIKYSKLHEERATLLKDLYRELFDLENALAYMTTAFQGPEWTKDDDRRVKAFSQLQKCLIILETNRIFFTSEFCSLLETNLEECLDVINQMENAKFRGKIQESSISGYNKTFKDGETPLDIWFAQEEKVKTKIRDGRIQLAEKFREIIGVEDKK